MLCWTSIDIECNNKRWPDPSEEDEVLWDVALGMVWFLEFLRERRDECSPISKSISSQLRNAVHVVTLTSHSGTSFMISSSLLFIAASLL